ncbi:arylsulfatase [Lacibacter sp.]|uniref:arylsulfatase n=1 Tax=Lacibacter sp. TaxID=1915409 RepID=UPI002B4B6FB4|nr:arylsulfatase [Lacibacter sp.]HLP37623.1 arylsulfatase [Lacibacter sp.]
MMFTKYFYFLVISYVFSFQLHAQQTKRKQPNIIVILADDMGYSDIGCYGGEINTPNLDLLAKEGVRFTEFYNGGRCCPTRASLLTGLYPHKAGIGNMVYANQGPGYVGYLTDNTVTLAEVLKSAGYQTMMSGKWHVGHKKAQWPTDRGFDKFYGINLHVDSYYKVLEGCDIYYNGSLLVPHTAKPVNTLFPEKEFYTTDAFTDYGIQFLKETKHDTAKPFFLYLAYNSPHFPLEAPDEDIANYTNAYSKGWDKMREERLEKMKRLGIVPQHARLSPSENPRWDTVNTADKKELEFRRAIYAAQVDRMDQNIGRVIQWLKQNGEYENTLILFLSDNGASAERGMYGMNFDQYKISNYGQWKKEGGWSVSQGQVWANFSNTPFRLYKQQVHQGGIATPMIVHWPAKIKDGGTIARQVGHLIDIMPTLCAVAGAAYPSVYQKRKISAGEGINLLPWLLNPSSSLKKRTIGWEHIGNAGYRDGDYKIAKRDKGEWELFNLKEDPTEMTNLAFKMPGLLKEMQANYEAWAMRNLVRQWPLKKQ